MPEQKSQELDLTPYMEKLSFDKDLISTCNAIHDRIDKNWDIVIALDGEEGSGKSTLGIELGWLLDKNFFLDNNIAYLPTPKEIEQKFKSLKAKQLFMVDEAVKALYKLQFMNKFQTRINEMYATERWQNKITLLLIPRFTDLNEFFRNHRVKFWIHIIDRGLAVVFAKDEVNIFGQDKWHIAEEYARVKRYIKNRKFASFSAEEKLKIYEKSQHFMFSFRYPILPEEVENRYKELKEFYRHIPNDTEKSLKEIYAKRLADEGMTNVKISEILGVSQQWIGKLVSK